MDKSSLQDLEERTANLDTSLHGKYPGDIFNELIKNALHECYESETDESKTKNDNKAVRYGQKKNCTFIFTRLLATKNIFCASIN